MYLKFYGLKEKPFEITLDPKFLYLSEHHREALAHLTYAVKEGKGFTVITGEVGTGKTTLIHMLLGKIEANIRTAHIFNPKLNSDDFLNYICEDFGLKSERARSKGQNLSALHEFLIDCYARRERVVLIIDEAQALDRELLEEVRLLTNLETSTSKLLQLILVGQPELDDILADPRFRQLKQRVSVRYRIQPLNRPDTVKYIHKRLRIAGAGSRTIFDAAAMKAIYRYSVGIPRLINIICDNALLTGFASDRRVIGKSIIKEVIRDREGKADAYRPRTKWLMALMLLTALIAGILIYWE